MEQKLLAAAGDYGALTKYLRENDLRRLLLVHGASFRRLRIAGYFRRLEAAGVSVVPFSDFQPNPRYESVISGVELFQREGCDAVAAVGGGSAIDVAKCVKLYAGMDLSRNCLRQPAVPNDIPLIAIPTTAGSGSESTRFAVIYYRGEKQSVTDDSCLPSAVVLDPSVLETLPPYQKKSAMMDALCHGIESFWSLRATEESRAYAREAIGLILRHMEGYLAGREEDQPAMLRAAGLAGKAINISQTTAGHAMCYRITGLYGAAHGHAAALCVRKLWPYMLGHPDRAIQGGAFLMDVLSRLAGVMDCRDVWEGPEKFQHIFNALALPVPAYTEAELTELAASVNSERLRNNPVTLSADALKSLYRQILRKAV